MRRVVVLIALSACNGGVTPVDSDDLVDGSPVRSCRAVIEAELPEGVEQGAVSGTFSAWDPVPLVPATGGRLQADLGTLVPGTYAWKYVWDGTYEAEPPPDVPTTWADGVENRALIVPDCRLPSLEAVEIVATPAGRIEAEVQWSRGRDGAPLDPDSLLVELGGVPAQATIDRAGLIRVQADDLAPGKHSLVMHATDADGNIAEPLWLPVWVEDEAFAWSDGVLYFAFLDRFRDGGPSPAGDIDEHLPGAGYRGGDLVGLRDALREGYFDDLGVRSIWLSPINENPDGAWPGREPGPGYTGYHGYWPAAPRTVEERLGTTEIPADEALHQVVDEAHARGIRVVMDVVLNHVHQEHPWVQEHPEWFDLEAPCTCGDPGCGWEEKPRTCRFAPYLPDVEYRAPGAVEAQLDEIQWWLQTYDLDGLRLDAVKHMDHVVLRRLALDLEQRVHEPGGASVYLVGETFTGAGQQGLIREYVADWELDGQFDFPLFWRIREAVREDGSFRPLAAEVRAGEAAYGAFEHGMSPFFGNHDVARLATELAGCSDWSAMWGVCADVLAEGDADSIDAEQERLIRRMATAWALVVTRPGVPLLYYGDEVGLAGANDPDNRRDMPWELTAAQQALRERVSELATLRADSPSLRRGESRELWVDDDLYIIARHVQDELSIAWFSSSGARTSVRVPIPAELAGDGTTVEDSATGESLVIRDGHLELPLPGQDWSHGVLRGTPQ